MKALRGKNSKFKKHLTATIAGFLVALCISMFVIAYPSLSAPPEQLPKEVVQVKQREDINLALKRLTNSRTTNFTLVNKTETIKPENEISLEENLLPTHEVLNNAPIYPSSQANFPYVYPVMGPRKSSGYGLRVHPIRRFTSKHQGVDLAAPVGASIRAMAQGKVIFADPYAGYGNLVVIDHGNGVSTHYAHCDKLVVQIGEKVEMGQTIAEVGSTGLSSGPHLHLEVRLQGQSINPEKFFVGLADKAEG